MTDPASPSTMTARRATALLSAEIALLSDRLLRLEEGIEAFCKQESATQGDALKQLQEIDFLVQTADTLTNYAQWLSGNLDSDARIDLDPILKSLPLRDVARRLAGAKVDTSHGGFELL